MTAQGGGHRAGSHEPGRRPTAVRRRGLSTARKQQALRRAFAAALLLIVTPAYAAPDTLTLAEARALSPEALAKRVLGVAGGLVQSAHVSAGRGMFANPYRLASIEFATAPRSAGLPGLCQADMYVVRFHPLGGEERQDLKADLPSVPVDLDRTTRFRSVDAGPAPIAGWNDAYGKAMDVACAGTGPVLRADGTSPFFVSLNDGQPDPRGIVTSGSLAVLKAAVRPVPGVVPTCATSLPGQCARQIVALVERAPDEVRQAVCEKAPGRRCVEVRYDLGWLHWLTLRIESEGGRGAVTYWSQPAPIRAVHLDEVQAVE